LATERCGARRERRRVLCANSKRRDPTGLLASGR
jgi:hypothetical protein